MYISYTVRLQHLRFLIEVLLSSLTNIWIWNRSQTATLVDLISAFDSAQRQHNSITALSIVQLIFNQFATVHLPYTPYLPPPGVDSSEVERALFDLHQTSSLDLDLPQLPHKSQFGVLPFPGEDSASSRQQSLVHLGFAPFKPP